MLSHILSGYIDDIFNQGDTYNDCVHNVIDTIVLFDSLNFVTHPDKTSFMPKQVIKILGKPFPIDNLMKYKMKNKPKVNIVEI